LKNEDGIQRGRNTPTETLKNDSNSPRGLSPRSFSPRGISSRGLSPRGDFAATEPKHSKQNLNNNNNASEKLTTSITTTAVAKTGSGIILTT
jgi:hypothetical protein